MDESLTTYTCCANCKQYVLIYMERLILELCRNKVPQNTL